MGINMETALHIAVISNIIFEPHFSSVAKKSFGENTVVSFVQFGEQTEIEYQAKLARANLIVVWINLENLLHEQDFSGAKFSSNEIIVLCNKIYADLINFSHSKILWFSFEDYYLKLPVATGHLATGFVDKLNLSVQEILGNQVSFIDLKYLMTEVGLSNVYDTKSNYRWNAPYSATLIKVAINEMCKQYLIEKGITKKCLILDCDNVLWGGVLSETGVENLKLSSGGLGRVYKDFQRFVLALYYHGVILAVCSKNDLSDIMVMFNNHSEMVLKEEHIACFQVNWQDKPCNIMKIAETLNINLDSIVFVDDSPFEIEAVKALLPAVTTILFKQDMDYGQFSCFNLKNNVDVADVEKRNKTYRTNTFREELKAKYDYSDYINALEIKIDIHETIPIEYGRISELTQRTNKCTNGKRYTVPEIKERVASNAVNLYSVFVSDRFSDLGLVGAIEVKGDILTLFSLSCRSLGMEIEKKMIEYIEERHQINIIIYKSMGRNEALKSLLSEVFSNAIVIDNENM